MRVKWNNPHSGLYISLYHLEDFRTIQAKLIAENGSGVEGVRPRLDIQPKPESSLIPKNLTLHPKFLNTKTLNPKTP